MFPFTMFPYMMLTAPSYFRCFFVCGQAKFIKFQYSRNFLNLFTFVGYIGDKIQLKISFFYTVIQCSRDIRGLNIRHILLERINREIRLTQAIHQVSRIWSSLTWRNLLLVVRFQARANIHCCSSRLKT